MAIMQVIMGTDWGKNSWGKLASIIAAYFVVMFCAFNISGLVLGKFFLANIISIFLPGVAIWSLLNIKLSKVGAFCISYILGYAVIVLEYFVVMLSSHRISFFMISCFMAVISILVIGMQYKKRGKVLFIHTSGLEGVEICIFALMMVLNILVYSANHLGPDVLPFVTGSRDIIYWANNTVSLELAWPPSDLFFTGVPLNYHYFSNIPIAFLSMAYGIDVFTLSFPLYSFTKAIVMVGAVQFLCNTLQLEKKWAIIAYLLLLLTSGYERCSVVTIYHHLLYAPFGFDIGYAYAIVFITLLIRQWSEERLNYRLWAVILLVWAMDVGAKTPVAAIMLIFTAYICFYWLYKKKFSLSFGYGVPVLFLFWLIGKYCVGMFATMQGDAAWALSLYGLDEHRYMHYEAVKMITGILGTGGKIFIFLIMATLRTIAANFPVIVGGIMAIYLTVRLAREKLLNEEEINLRLALLVTALGGLGLWHLVNAGGDSEMYFAMAALIPIVILLLKTAKDYENLRLNGTVLHFMGREKLWRKVFIRCLVFGVLLFFCYVYGSNGVVKQSMWAMRNFYQAATTYEVNPNSKGIRSEDVKALAWLRDNAEATAVVMSDKAVIDNDEGFYYYGLFCERQQYMEGIDMLLHLKPKIGDIIAQRKQLVFDVYNNKAGAIAKAKADGVNYIVQTVDVTPQFRGSVDELDLVASSDTIKIYKIK